MKLALVFPGQGSQSVGMMQSFAEVPAARDTFAEAMRAEGIAMDAGFRGNHLIHGSRRFRAVGELPEATRADGDLVVLHHPVLLEEAAAIAQVADAVRKIQRNSFAIQESRPTC